MRKFNLVQTVVLVALVILLGSVQVLYAADSAVKSARSFVMNMPRTNSDLITLTVTPPASGYILLFGVANVYFQSHPSAGSACFDLTQGTATNFTPPLSTASNNCISGAVNSSDPRSVGFSGSVSLISQVPVTGGTTITFHIRGSFQSILTTSQYISCNTSLTALFVPGLLP